MEWTEVSTALCYIFAIQTIITLFGAYGYRRGSLNEDVVIFGGWCCRYSFTAIVLSTIISRPATAFFSFFGAYVLGKVWDTTYHWRKKCVAALKPMSTYALRKLRKK